MKRCSWVMAVISALSLPIVLSVKMTGPKRCTSIKNPVPTYSVNRTIVLGTLAQCAIFCENFATTMKFYAYQNKTCKVYAKYPGYTDTDNKLYCYATPVQRRYCIFLGMLPYSEALSLCRSFNLRLVSFTSWEQNNWLFEKYKIASCQSGVVCSSLGWTSGISASGTPGTWTWRALNNTRLNMSAWVAGNPSNWYYTVGLSLEINGNLRTNTSWWVQRDPLDAGFPWCEIDTVWT